MCCLCKINHFEEREHRYHSRGPSDSEPHHGHDDVCHLLTLNLMRYYVDVCDSLTWCLRIYVEKLRRNNTVSARAIKRANRGVVVGRAKGAHLM